jgi:preprotein translocase subunit SecB
MSADSKKTLAAKFAELAAAVELLEVRPVGFLAQVVGAIPPLGTSLAAEIKSQLTAKQEGEGQFEVYADFALDAHLETDPKEEFLEIRYTIISRYRVPPEHSLEQEVLDFFARTNGMVHLWPYLRAFVANSCAQMGIAPITLPPFRVQQPARKPEKKPTPEAN